MYDGLYEANASEVRQERNGWCLLVTWAALFSGAGAVSDRAFFWRLSTQDAVREGKWKYVRKGAVRNLFDLSSDQREQADFSEKNPEMIQRLSSEFDKWNAQMLPRPTPD